MLKINDNYIITVSTHSCTYNDNTYIDKGCFEYSIVNMMEEKKVPLLIADIYNCIYLSKYSSCEGEMCSLLGLPIVHKDEMLGAVLLWCDEPDSFKRRDKDLAATFVGQTIAAIVNAKLFGEVKERSAAIKNLLNNARQGFLSFNEDLLIDNEYSYECERIFGLKLTGLKITDLLFR